MFKFEYLDSGISTIENKDDYNTCIQAYEDYFEDIELKRLMAIEPTNSDFSSIRSNRTHIHINGNSLHVEGYVDWNTIERLLSFDSDVLSLLSDTITWKSSDLEDVVELVSNVVKLYK